MKFAEIFNTVILLGTLQGVILGVLLFTSKKYRRANRFLAIVMLIFGMACFNLFLYNTSFSQYFPWLAFALNFVPLIVIMPVGPLIYFYVKTSLNPEFKLSKTDRWHFAPVIIDFGAQLTALIFVTGVLSGLIQNNPQSWSLFIDNYNVYSDIPRWLSITLYLGLSYRYLYKQKPAHNQLHQWFRQFIRIFLVFQAIWLLYLIPYVIPSLTNLVLDTVDWYPVYVPLVALIYTLGIKGYLMPAQEPPPLKTPLSIPPDTINEVLLRLKSAMEEDKLYLKPALNLTSVAEYTGVASKTISSVLNQHLQKSFNEYINNYRITAFKQNLLNPAFKHLTIMGMALESGFNSQATFQRAFKQATGMSPSEFVRDQADKKGKLTQKLIFKSGFE